MRGSDKSRIFDKPSVVSPAAMRTVAERRFDDASTLCETGDNARATGSQYLCGIVIELLLKAQLAKWYANVARKRSHDSMTQDERQVWSLIWRSHDLEEMLIRLPSLMTGLQKRSEQAGRPYLQWLQSICGTWTIYARYSSHTTTIADAREMLEKVRELKEVMK